MQGKEIAIKMTKKMKPKLNYLLKRDKLSTPEV